MHDARNHGADHMCVPDGQYGAGARMPDGQPAYGGDVGMCSDE